MNADKWCTIESDPGVFTELIKSFGAKGLQVEELATLEESEFNLYKPIYGLIFLFRWSKKLYKVDKPVAEVPDMFFASQVITNACATQAIISVLLNLEGVDIGEELKNFREFTIGMGPKECGMVLKNADKIRQAHNSFSHPEPFEFEEVAAKEGSDVFHFISYIPFHDGVYELDGMQKGPVLIGKLEGDKDWLEVAKGEIQKRIEEYTTSEIHFNLLAIIGDREEVLHAEIQKDKTLKAELAKRLGLPSDPEVGDTAKFKAEIEKLPTDSKDMGNLHETLEVKINENTQALLYEGEKRVKWKRENQRRRHNYLPLIFELLRLLAQKDKLPGLIDQATEEMKKRKAKKDEEKKANEQKKEEKS